MFVIHRDSAAFRALAEAFANPNTYKVSFDIRDDGLAVKPNEGMWTSTLPTMTPRVKAWADSFGDWHAEVEFAGAINDVKAMTLARARVMEELTARSPRGTEPVFTLVIKNHVSYQGATTYQFVETDNHVSTP